MPTSANAEIPLWTQPAVPLVAPVSGGDAVFNSLTVTTFVSAFNVFSTGSATVGGSIVAGSSIVADSFRANGAGGLLTTTVAASAPSTFVAIAATTGAFSGLLTTSAGITNTGAITTATVTATGAISCASLTVSGAFTVNAMTVTTSIACATFSSSGLSSPNSLAVTGATTIGTTLAVTGATTLTGLLTANGHLAFGGSAPTIASAGLGVGTTGITAGSVTGTDMGGILNFTTTAAPVGSAGMVTITFNVAFAVAPKSVVIYPANAAAIAAFNVPFISTIGTTGFILSAGGAALIGTTAYSWCYTVT